VLQICMWIWTGVTCMRRTVLEKQCSVLHGRRTPRFQISYHHFALFHTNCPVHPPYYIDILVIRTANYRSSSTGIAPV
jgi:hypothetical protein